MHSENVATQLPKYYSELFADRTDAIQKVQEAIDQLQTARTAPNIVSFRGQRGMGKSWLALHLQRSNALTCPPDALRLFIGLGDQYVGRIINKKEDIYLQDDTHEWLFERYTDNNPQHIDGAATLHTLLMWIAAHIGALRANDVSPAQQAAWIINRLKEISFGRENQYRYLICIIDSAYEAYKPFRDALDQMLLNDLVQLPNVLLVITGRGNKPAWISFYLRQYEQTIELKGLDKEGKHEDIDETRYRVTRLLSTSTAGKEVKDTDVDTLLRDANWLPLNTVLLHLIATRTISSDAAFDELLRYIPNAKRAFLQGAIYLLCVLDGFTQSEVAEMRQSVTTIALLATYPDKEKLEALAQHLDKDILDTLFTYQLAPWNSEQSWWELDISLRTMARYYLEHERPTLWAKLNGAVYKMYHHWGENYRDDYYRDLARKYSQWSTPKAELHQETVQDETLSARLLEDDTDEAQTGDNRWPDSRPTPSGELV